MTQTPRSQERQLIAEETAKMLLEIKAIHFNTETPFIFTSGWASPVYTDMRKVISFPRVRKNLIDFAAISATRRLISSPVAKRLAFPMPPGWLTS